VSASRPTNTSRAYWELKAEQVMDRVFEHAGQSTATGSPSVSAARLPRERPSKAEQEETIEVEVRETPPTWPAVLLQHQPRLAMGVAAGIGCVLLAGGVSLWYGGHVAREDLRQERNLRLLEGIRSLGQEGPTPAQPGNTAEATAANDGLPPPPPSEPWIEELGQLNGGGGGVAPLQVPLSGTLQAPAPAAGAVAAAPSAAGDLPELLGVVQIPGKPGSAIFQIGGSSSNALVGESIGSSGWKLVSTSGDSAVIERGGVSRRVSISSGF
jgi:hypothetical protein